jgi:hypothetical protein
MFLAMIRAPSLLPTAFHAAEFATGTNSGAV